MRMRFSEMELRFLKEILADCEGRVNRQVLNLQEEAEHLRLTVPALRHTLHYDPYSVHRTLKDSEERLRRISFQWLPLNVKHRVILHGLILRLNRALEHKVGRTPRGIGDMQTCLASIEPIKTRKTENPVA
jgi:hypothetical protein